MKRLIKFIIIIPLLTLLWAFSNSFGITHALTESAGLPDLDWVTIPGIEKFLEVDEDADAKRAKVADELAERTEPLREKAAKAAEKHQQDLHENESGTKSGGGVDKQTVRRVEKRLGTIDVEPAGPTDRYERDKFGGGWESVDGCDMRNRILARDLTGEKVGSDDCTVESGTLADPYTGETIDFERGQGTSSQVQIDHIFPLSLAWQHGARGWSGARRTTFANDPSNLLASDGPANMSKGDSGPGEWLPENKDYRCIYIVKVVAVATEYDLSMSRDGHQASKKILNRCA